MAHLLWLRYAPEDAQGWGRRTSQIQPNSRGLFCVDRIALLAHLLQLVEERAPADPERTGGLGAVEMILPQGQQDRLAFDFLQARLFVGSNVRRRGRRWDARDPGG